MDAESKLILKLLKVSMDHNSAILVVASEVMGQQLNKSGYKRLVNEYKHLYKRYEQTTNQVMKEFTLEKVGEE